ncbi:hypothetical protein JTB14_025570 [Gonioctena quinquepunctata]|nr:hypothetical protein JTB14_025570 [Gonioctena quinquepunctata]
MDYSCTECKEKFNPNIRDEIKCNSCSRSFHYKCSGLGGSKLKVMELKTKRKLQFFCDDCQQGLKILPTLLAKIEKLTSEVEALRTQPTRVINEETFFVEISERQKRMCNVMFFNLPEQKDAQTDAEFVDKFVQEIANNNIETKTFSDLPDYTPLQRGNLNKLKEEMEQEWQSMLKSCFC